MKTLVRMSRTQITRFIFLLAIILFSCTENGKYNQNKTEINGVSVFTDLSIAQNSAQEKNKLILIVFDSPNVGCCKNSTQMLFKYLKLNSIAKKYEIVYLKMDDRTRIHTDKSLEINGELKQIKNIGELNTSIILELTGKIVSPYHLIVDSKLNKQKPPKGYFSNSDEIEKFLNEN